MTDEALDRNSMTESHVVLDRAERDLIEMIVMIQRDYQKQIDPLVKQLARLRALRPLPPILLDTWTASK